MTEDAAPPLYFVSSNKIICCKMALTSALSLSFIIDEADFIMLLSCLLSAKTGAPRIGNVKHFV